MRYLLIILLSCFSYVFGQDTTNCILKKKYDLNNSELDWVGAITFEEDVTFYVELKPFLNYSRKTLNLFDSYYILYKNNKHFYKHAKKAKDTLFLHFRTEELIKSDTTKPGINPTRYLLDVQYFSYDTEHSTSLTEVDSTYLKEKTKNILVIRNYWESTMDYLFQLVVKRNKVKILNHRSGKFENKVLKEEFSYYYAPLCAGGGVWWRISGTIILLKRIQTWIS